jgi:antitoxin component YwqK of YwqJK toxin-antitoxin module
MLNVIFHIYIYIHIYIHTPPMLNDLTSVVSEYLTSVTYSSCANSITAKVITRGDSRYKHSYRYLKGHLISYYKINKYTKFVRLTRKWNNGALSELRICNKQGQIQKSEGYYPNGSIMCKIIYLGNECVEECWYHDNGTPSNLSTYNLQGRYGRSYMWDRNGKLEMTIDNGPGLLNPICAIL